MPMAQLAFVQGLFMMAFLIGVAVCIEMPPRGRVLTNRWILLRSGLDATAALAYTIGLAHLQLANATAIFMTTPLIMTVLAVLGFEEGVSATSWRAVVVGFIGVLLVVKPAGDAFNRWSLLVFP